MKKHVLFVGFLLLSGSLLAQNKTLGVGVTTPNSNAALHVESPTGNQGFILPRLTTTQRTATSFVSALGAADNGLMVYDTDLKTIYIWNGVVWKTSAQAAGGAKLAYPSVDTIASAPNNSNLLRILYAGSATENVGVAHFENMNPNNGFSALFARSNSATNGAVDIVVNNTANNNDAIGVTTNGVGRAGSFMVNNAANQSAAIYATTNGTPGAQAALSAAIYGETNTAFSAITGRVVSGFSNGVSGLSASPETGSFAVLGSNSGGGQAGIFNISSATNSQTAVEVSTNGTGGAGKFTVNNVNSTFPALMAQTNSNQPLSAPIYGLNTGTGDVAASFRITNAASTFPALFAESNGTGRTATFRKLGTTGSNPAVFVSSAGGHGIWADHNGATGYAAIIQNINATNTDAAMFVEAVGTGPSVWAQKSDPTSTGDAIFGEHAGSTGSAGNFQNTNGGNSAAALFAMTNAGGGSSIGAINSGNGNALTIFTGGVRLSVETVSSTTIANRAAAYRITGGGTTFTFGFGTSDGEVFMVFNDSGAGITVEGVSINNGEGKTIIRFASGVYRGL